MKTLKDFTDSIPETDIKNNQKTIVSGISHDDFVKNPSNSAIFTGRTMLDGVCHNFMSFRVKPHSGGYIVSTTSISRFVNNDFLPIEKLNYMYCTCLYFGYTKDELVMCLESTMLLLLSARNHTNNEYEYETVFSYEEI